MDITPNYIKSSTFEIRSFRTICLIMERHTYMLDFHLRTILVYIDVALFGIFLGVPRQTLSGVDAQFLEARLSIKVGTHPPFVNQKLEPFMSYFNYPLQIHRITSFSDGKSPSCVTNSTEPDPKTAKRSLV